MAKPLSRRLYPVHHQNRSKLIPFPVVPMAPCYLARPVHQTHCSELPTGRVQQYSQPNPCQAVVVLGSMVPSRVNLMNNPSDYQLLDSLMHFQLLVEAEVRFAIVTIDYHFQSPISLHFSKMNGAASLLGHLFLHPLDHRVFPSSPTQQLPQQTD